MAGKTIVERCLATHPKSKKPRREGFLDEDEIAQAIEESLGERWRKLICNGENYVESTLSDQAKKWFVNNLLGDHVPGTPDWTDEEQSLLSNLDHGDGD